MQQNEQVRADKDYLLSPGNELTVHKMDISNSTELAKRDGPGELVRREGGDAEADGADQDEDQGVNEADEGDEQAGDDQENYGSESMNGGMSNMMFSGSGDFNQMQMMMAMQNGMGSNTFGNFPMMGMTFTPVS